MRLHIRATPTKHRWLVKCNLSYLLRFIFRCTKIPVDYVQRKLQIFDERASLEKTLLLRNRSKQPVHCQLLIKGLITELQQPKNRSLLWSGLKVSVVFSPLGVRDVALKFDFPAGAKSLVVRTGS